MTVLNLGILDGANGFSLSGDSNYDYSGFSVSGAGDVNGDGFEDFIVGAYGFDLGGTVDAGLSYLIFGKGAPFAAFNSLGGLTFDGSQGFQLSAGDAGGYSGRSVSGAGDVNGDGLADFIVGAPDTTADGVSDSGTSFIVFGQTNFGSPFVNLDTLDASQGARLGGDNVLGDYSGSSVSSAGDINGDGFDDVIIGAPGAQTLAGYQNGVAYVVFGTDGAFPANANHATLNGANGFVIEGLGTGDLTGFSVANAGDLNGDDIDDLIVGAPSSDAAGPNSGQAYVVFGKTGAFANILDLGVLDGTDGFRVNNLLNVTYGASSVGVSVGAAGDVNGDGFEDIVIGADYSDLYGYSGGYNAGRSFVLFGGDAGFAPSLDLGVLDATQGFEIVGAAGYSRSGYSVTGAGDVNGDGFDDLIVGAPGGSGPDNVFVVFGDAAIGLTFDLASINAGSTNGIRFDPVAGLERTGVSVESAGDIDGDGFDDIIFGAPDAAGLQAGQTFVIFGADSGDVTDPNATAGDDVLTGAAGADVIVAGRGNDLVIGGGGADAIRGGEGDDAIEVTDLTFLQIDGGTGKDTLKLDAASLALDLTLAGTQNIAEIEAIDLAGVSSSLTLDKESVLALSSTSNRVEIKGDPTSSLFLADEANWTAVTATNADVLLKNGQAELLVSRDVAIPAAIVIPPLKAVDLGALDGADGFRIEGETPIGFFGHFLNNAGDVNGDGFEDFIVGTNYYYSGAGSYGESFVIFGDGGAVPALLPTTALDGSNGFQLTGTYDSDKVGRTVGGGGDFNGDGIADIVIGGYGGYYSAGESYVVFGTDLGFAGNIDLGALDGADGFQIDGFNGYDEAGVRIDIAGDFNGDGFDDLILSAINADPGGRFLAGEAYVVFGTDLPLGANFDLSTIDGDNGFNITGANDYDYLGSAVGPAGDIDGDGFDDILIAAAGGGPAFVILGQPDGAIGVDLDRAALDATQGFTISGATVNSVNAAGDVNGDGLQDFVVGAPGEDPVAGANAGAAFVVFGTAGGFGVDVNLTGFDGSNGFRVEGLYGGDQLGFSVSGAGDVNGDGFDDLIFGAPGTESSANSVVIFGRAAGGFSALVDATALDGTDGFLIEDAVAGGDGSGFGVSGAGDINGDGFDDLLIGTPYAENYARTPIGAASVIFGVATDGAAQVGDAADNLLLGSVGVDDILIGGQGSDQLIGDGGLDVLRGGEGDDILSVQDFAFRRVDGGTGDDVLVVNAAAVTIDFTAAGDERLQEIEAIDFFGGGANITIDVQTVLNFSSTTNALSIIGDGVLTLSDAGWTTLLTDAVETIYVNGAATLAIDRNIAVNAVVNTDPTAVADAVTTNEEVTLAGDVLADNGGGVDDDIDGDALIIDTTPVVDVANGVLVLDETGTFTYTPDVDFFGTDSFSYTLLDGKGGTATGVVTITVANVNDAPVAQDDLLTTDEDTLLSGDVLADNGNGIDDDVDGDLLTIDTTPVVDVANGTLVLNANGTFDYTPDQDFNGSDSFTYTVLDGNGGTDTAVVSITVNAVNDAPVAQDDSVTTNEDTPLSGDVLADNGNGIDDDVEGDTLTIVTSPVVDVANGTLVLNANGAFDYTPDANFNGSDSFIYTVLDGNGGTATAQVTIVVVPVNDDPVAQDDLFATNEDTLLSGDVLPDNGAGIDDDIDGDALTIDTTPVVDVANGSLVLNANGAFDYTPNTNFNGVDSFTYTLLDGNGGTDTAVVTITVNAVNDAPVAQDDLFTANEDTLLSGDVLADNGAGFDDDIDGDPLTIDTAPLVDVANGTLVLNANGTFDYTPDADFTGTDSFTYTLLDGNGGTAAGLVTITVNAVNDDPVAQDDLFATNEDTLLSGDVLADNGNGLDDDIDGDLLTVDTAPLVDVANGTLVLNTDGTFDYTPDADFNGVDSFTYTVLDGNGGSDAGLVTITVLAVNDDPVAEDDAFAAAQGVALNGDVLADNGNGVDNDVDGDLLTIDTTPLTDVANGTLTLNTDGTFTYVPDAAFTGVDSFEYLLLDGNGGTDTGLVTITVAPNAPPVAADDAFATTQGAAVVGDLLDDNGNGADLDPGAAGLTVETAPVVGPAFGGVKIASDGTFVYTPDDAFFGSDSFQYRVTNDSGSDIAQVDITVTEDDGGASFNSAGDDVFVGDGVRAVRYDNGATGRIFADLGAGFISGDASVGVDRVSNFFDLVGTDFSDFLFGSAAAPGVAEFDLQASFESFAPLGGDNLVFGRDGLDRVDYAAAPGGVFVNLLDGVAFDNGFGGVDTLFDVEGVRGSNFDDDITGDDGDNFFQPLRGADAIDGGGGIDLLIYEGVAGAMTIDLKVGTISHETGQAGSVVNIENIETGVGDDRLLGTNGVNEIAAGAGDDFVAGRSGADLIDGQEGDDRLFGNSGDDELFGGDGDDEINGSFGADQIAGQADNDTMLGGDGDDRIVGYSGDDTAFGDAGDDRLFGNSGDDKLNGGLGDDILSGAGQSDVLDGGLGDDVLTGGANDDIFVIGLDAGADEVTDFSLVDDLIDVSATGLANFGDISAILSDGAGGATLTFGGVGNELVLTGIAAADLNAAHFIF